MKQLNTITNSYELFTLINEHRVMAGKAPMKKHRDLVVKIEDELGDLCGRKKTPTSSNKTGQGVKDIEAYELSADDVLLVSMRESKQVRKTVLAYIRELESENTKLMDIVFDVITNKAFLGQEFALKCAGIHKPRKIMELIRKKEGGIDWLIERGYFSYRQVGATKSESCWCWSQEGFQWLLNNVNMLNEEVEKRLKAA